MEQDQAKIKAKIAELGVGWVEAEGFFAITVVEMKDDKSLIFQAAKGIPLKVFVNRITGEVRSFLADNFF